MVTDGAASNRSWWRLAGWTLAVALVASLAVLGLKYWHQAHAPVAASVSVAGGDGGGWPRATPDSEGFDTAALDRAVAYARRSGAQALLVTRHAHLLVDDDGAGLSAGDGIDGGAFAELLVALAAGVAAHDYGLPEPRGALAADRLAAQISAASHLAYPQFLSRYLWQPLNAAPARILLNAAGRPAPAACCFIARASDWLRVAELLIADGRFEGTQVLPAGWARRVQQASAEDPGRAFGLWLAPGAHGAEPFLAHDVLMMRGLGRTRLWVAPQQHLAILLVDQRPADGALDETRLPNMVLRALREAPSGAHQNIDDLVPGH
jgi:hypothetical protein